ncbi:MAG: hypothetical protein CBE14_001955 [Rickettsiales bacterium TMED254]|nr:MAG: hypothetical protein CBE14_001955 [Rickettsiales bacterium TMED254]|tara:strand:- start:471 stop:899 length:429 start_codon:yes stop_codon:yes gene_type:complete
MVRKTFHQMFQYTEKLSKKDKIKHLQMNSSPGLKMILGYTYDPNIKWLLPESDPPYKQNSTADNEGQLEYETRKFYLFIDGPSETQQNLKPMKREQLFIDMLENLNPGDAKLLLAIKNRKLPYKGITKAIVKEAFPNLARNW